jgi:hypothetical protein
VQLSARKTKLIKGEDKYVFKNCERYFSSDIYGNETMIRADAGQLIKGWN